MIRFYCGTVQLKVWIICCFLPWEGHFIDATYFCSFTFLLAIVIYGTVSFVRLVFKKLIHNLLNGLLVDILFFFNFLHGNFLNVCNPPYGHFSLLELLIVSFYLNLVYPYYGQAIIWRHWTWTFQHPYELSFKLQYENRNLIGDHYKTKLI